jgi:hypothetical protein
MKLVCVVAIYTIFILMLLSCLLCMYVCMNVCMNVRTYVRMYACRHDSRINIKIVYMATTQTDFMRIVATKDFSPFYCKYDNFNVLMVL